MDKTLLLAYLDLRRSPLAGNQDGVRLHQTLCEQAPAFYLKLLADLTSDMSHKHEILANVLERSAAHTIEREQIVATLLRLPLTDALAILDGIRRRKINNRRAHDLVLSFLLGNTQFSTLAATRKQYIVRLLKHVMGERTWSAAKRFLAASTEDGEVVLRRELLRFAAEGELVRVREALCFLAGISFTPTEPVLLRSQAARQDLEQGSGLPRETLLGLRGIYHREVPLKHTLYLSAPRDTVVRGDGPLTRLYKEAFQAAEKYDDQVGMLETSAEATNQPTTPQAALLTQLGRMVAGLLRQPLVEPSPVQSSVVASAESVLLDAQVREQLMQEVSSLPFLTGRLAIVLDLSASMLSSGERMYHPAALALALTRLLQERVSEVIVQQVGEPILSMDVLPRPQNATDLATALLEVAEQQPQLILLLTDGYENQRQGDTDQIVQGLRQLGLIMPICQIIPLFTLAENLAQRRLSAAVSLIPLEHERGIRELLMRVQLAASEEALSSEMQAQFAELLLKEVIA
jgi:hypothetical protein